MALPQRGIAPRTFCLQDRRTTTVLLRHVGFFSKETQLAYAIHIP